MSLVLHGSWSAGSFFVWAESSEKAERRGRQPRIPHHPYAASADPLRDALTALSPSSKPKLILPTERLIRLPSASGRPRVPSWLSAEDAESEDEPVSLLPWRIAGFDLDILSALDVLVALPSAGADGLRVGADLRFWSLVAKLGIENLSKQKYVPGIAKEGGQYRAVWMPIPDLASNDARLRSLVQAIPPVCRALSYLRLSAKPAEPRALVGEFLQRLVDRAAREWGRPRGTRCSQIRPDIASAWWSALRSDDGAIRVSPSQRGELARFYERWREWVGQLQSAEPAAFRLCFRLEPPEAEALSGSVAPGWTLRYMLQPNDDPSLLVPAEEVWRARGSTLRVLNRKFANAQEGMLAGLGLAGKLFPPVTKSLRTARPQGCTLTAEESYSFLREAGPLLKASGFGVLVPTWWDKPTARLGVRVRLESGAAAGGSAGGLLNMNSLCQFDWELAIGDQGLTREEFERLADLKMPLVQVRGQWVALQPEQVEAAIAFWEKGKKEVTLRDGLGLMAGAEPEIGGLPVLDVEATGWMGDLMAHLQEGDSLQELPPPGGFLGQLRPYQVRGYSWLAFLRKWGLGACLADDMGLGKTIQAIALLARDREAGVDGVDPALILCPTSVVGNWQREIQRFAPGLRVLVHHGSARAKRQEFVASVLQHDVVVSTYGLARRDADDLAEVRWSVVILDEAQNIKNPHARQAQAVRRLSSGYRIAMTGTPVENRLSELWSIMQFLNPGFLGSEEGFRREYMLPIERYQDREATEQFRRLIGPFVLRRLKTDPTIIQDLPEKMEMKVYCNLSGEQATLYEAVVKESLERIESADGMKRRGVVLGVLARLKQVCNHPAHFLGDGSALAGRSGKLDRLGEMLEEAFSVGDRALVFTQFAEMGHLLKAYVQELFGVQVLFLHGGTPQKQRDQMVERFQASRDGPPVFVLSLKAGGTGLNLTGANRVFHFDRWWNPAVENQATDRAFRIGQTRNVQVHKFICAGTLEERIDEMIESKKALAESVVGAGEGWLTELSTAELRDVIALRRE